MRRRAYSTILLAAILSGAIPARAQVRSVELYAPRPFGHLIGDTLSLTANIALDAPYALDPASLPQPRAVNYWLDLRDVRVQDFGSEDGVHRYTLDLVYQTFYAPLEPRRLTIPGLALSAIDGGRRVAVDIPSWSFLSSPLREIASTVPGQAMALRPDILPEPIPTSAIARSFVAALLLATASFGLLAWQRGWGIFGRRRSRPFARATRAIVPSLAGASSAPSAYRDALLTLHRAFDATAGKGVLAEDLPSFLAAHPAFRTVEAEMHRLFTASRLAFFGNDVAGAQNALPPVEVVAIARRLRAVERSVP